MVISAYRNDSRASRDVYIFILLKNTIHIQIHVLCQVAINERNMCFWFFLLVLFFVVGEHQRGW